MDLYLPNRKILERTGDLDYYHWNYQFPIKYIQRFRFKAILELLGNQCYDKLLEVGTGSGIFLPELDRHCRQLYACDIHDNIQAVERLCQLTAIKAEVRRCPIEATGFPDNMFDAIVAVSVLEFVDDLERSIDEIRRILKPSGVFLTICPQQSVLLDFVLNFYTRRKPDDEFGISRTRVSKTLEAQFNVIDKRIFPPIVGSIFPVYNYYKLSI
jgi:ubiquinone/menaquinone biosynthesis C-methylase UbiE